MLKRVKELTKKDRDTVLNQLRVRRCYYKDRIALIQDGHKPHHGLSLKELKVALVQVNQEIDHLTSKTNGKLSKNERRAVALNKLRVRRHYYIQRIAELESGYESTHGFSVSKLKKDLQLANRQLADITGKKLPGRQPTQKAQLVTV